MHAEICFNLILDDMITELCTIDEVSFITYSDSFLEAELERHLLEIVFETSVELGKKVYAGRKFKKTRSSFVDTTMDFLVESLMSTRMLDITATRGGAMLISDASDRIVDGIILERLTQRLITL
ncbi:hypothetical protein HDU96_004131 [Phlyctochytrium bullatum]|nr:hypothetical protein HDU96_004131 [Phlyctochytrium bullatum]